MNPTLVIGLGGTGQWVACHVLNELMLLHDLRDPDQLPQNVRILAIDTDLDNQAHVGFTGEGASTTQIGEVRLPNSMTVPLGAAVHDYAKRIAEGGHPQTAAWFDAEWFLGKASSAGLLNLADGAGAYRPLGRVAVPYNLTQAGTPTLRRVLEESIRRIVDNAGPMPYLTVCLAASLCGGTGAGMFVDVAYLVRKLAEPTEVKLAGYLALPQAFDATVPPDVTGREIIRRRAFAAMRELRRFARELDYDVGYPMYYAGTDMSDDRVLRGRLQNTLFDQLYYFDKGLTRPVEQNGRMVEQPVELENGIAPLIAEAMLLWIDENAGMLRSHGANLQAQKDGFISGGRLSANAATASGLGAFSLQLPLFHIVEGWAHKLARDVLDEFLGVHPEGKDSTSRTANRLRDNWAGGYVGQAGSSAALNNWQGGQVGGVSLGSLAMDHLETGVAGRSGKLAADKRQSEFGMRSSESWEHLLAPRDNWTEEEDDTRTEFLDPQSKTVERGLFRAKTVRQARVLTSTGDERKNPAMGAVRLEREVEDFFRFHLGDKDPDTLARGGRDFRPEGLYPRMLRRGASEHVGQFRRALRAWVAEVLNGVRDEALDGEVDGSRGRELRAGKLGHLLGLLQELSTMLAHTEDALRKDEDQKLGQVLHMREDEALAKQADAMKKSARAQSRYLREQQKILEKERDYAAVRQARWSAGQMLAFTRSALQAASEWRTELAEELYKRVWRGQEQVEKNRTDLAELGAVREVVQAPMLEDQRYQYYVADSIGELLNDLRWRVSEIEEYNREKDRREPKLDLELAVGTRALQVGRGDGNASAFLERHRIVFRGAWENETLLEWLLELESTNAAGWDIRGLSQRLVTRGRPALRQHDEAQPYKLAYVRRKEDVGGAENYVNRLRAAVIGAAGADATHSQLVNSSDPFRLTFLAFDELVDVEKLKAYTEGRDGSSGAGGYTSLPAKTGPGAGDSRKVLHVFPAEQNAADYEERLGYLLPDKVVMLLEDPSRFRLFVQAWAYGEVGGNGNILMHAHRIPDDAPRYAGLWVRRLATGPFPGEIDPLTRRPWTEPQLRWLTEPKPEKPPLIRAAEAFLIGGRDKWQRDGQRLSIDDSRVKLEVQRRQAELVEQGEVGQSNPALKQAVESFEDGEEKEKAWLKLADYEHLQWISERLSEFILGTQQLATAAGAKADSTRAQPGDDASAVDAARQVQFDAADLELDVHLLELMRRFIASELGSLEHQIHGRSKLTESRGEPRGSSLPY